MPKDLPFSYHNPLIGRYMSIFPNTSLRSSTSFSSGYVESGALVMWQENPSTIRSRSQFRTFISFLYLQSTVYSYANYTVCWFNRINENFINNIFRLYPGRDQDGSAEGSPTWADCVVLDGKPSIACTKDSELEKDMKSTSRSYASAGARFVQPWTKTMIPSSTSSCLKLPFISSFDVYRRVGTPTYLPGSLEQSIVSWWGVQEIGLDNTRALNLAPRRRSSGWDLTCYPMTGTFCWSYLDYIKSVNHWECLTRTRAVVRW